MLKQFLNSGSIKSLMLFDGANDQGAVVDPKIALREQISKGNLPEAEKEAVVIEPKEEDEENDEEEIDPDAVIKDPPEETPEKKAERETAERTAAKAKRKDERMQRRIDEATASAKAAKAELEAFKAANPDSKLTEEEVQSRAQKIADDKLAAKQVEDTNKAFQASCDKLQSAAIKLDKDFDNKINDIADQFGPIPSFAIATLADLDNGAEVLAYFANNEEFAENIYGKSPATMTRKLVEKSLELIAAKKKPKKEISKVPDPVEPVNGSRHVSTTITEADTKPENIDSYVAKRRLQQEAARKARGW